jgi:hypothetical protein
MLNLPPIQLALSPGESLILWQSRTLERNRPSIPIIEILPDNHAENGFNLCQRKGFMSYNDMGRLVLPQKKGEGIDIYC